MVISGGGRAIRWGVHVRSSYSFGGTWICYASAQMTWLKQPMGDKNQDSYASYYIHGLAVPGSAEDFFWLLTHFLGLLFCQISQIRWCNSWFLSKLLIKWENSNWFTVIKLPVSCKRAIFLQLSDWWTLFFCPHWSMHRSNAKRKLERWPKCSEHWCFLLHGLAAHTWKGEKKGPSTHK